MCGTVPVLCEGAFVKFFKMRLVLSPAETFRDPIAVPSRKLRRVATSGGARTCAPAHLRYAGDPQGQGCGDGLGAPPRPPERPPTPALRARIAQAHRPAPHRAKTVSRRQASPKRRPRRCSRTRSSATASKTRCSPRSRPHTPPTALTPHRSISTRSSAPWIRAAASAMSNPAWTRPHGFESPLFPHPPARGSS